MNDKPEHHEYHCRQFVIPMHIVILVEKEEITVKEAYLLALIDAMVNYKGLGCFASNSWLAKRIQTQTRQLQRYLNHLIDKKLIVVIKKGDGNFGSRVIETAWSRVNRSIDVRNDIHPPVRNDIHPPVRNDVHINTIRTDREKEENTVAAARTTESASLQLLNGSVEKETDGLLLAKRLYRLLASKNATKAKVNLKSWSRSFAELLKTRSVEQIGKVLSWYEENFDEKYTPHSFCAETFCKEEKFFSMEKMMMKGLSSTYGTSSHPISTKIAYTLDDGSIHYKKNPSLDWNEVERIKERLGDSFVSGFEFRTRDGKTKMYRSTQEFPREGPLKKKSPPVR